MLVSVRGCTCGHNLVLLQRISCKNNEPTINLSEVRRTTDKTIFSLWEIKIEISHASKWLGAPNMRTIKIEQSIGVVKLSYVAYKANWETQQSRKTIVCLYQCITINFCTHATPAYQIHTQQSIGTRHFEIQTSVFDRAGNDETNK